jgi:hypothetical protein
MNIILRNILAVIAGVVIGGVANMALIKLGGVLVPPPAGVDVSNMDSINASIHLYGPQHFLFPFLAHAAGALIGALVASLIAGNKRMVLALVVGVFFLIGGIVASVMIHAPTWFKVVDILIAYIPMAWIGWKLSGKK